MIVALGGFEAVKYFINLKSNRRKAAADASGASTDVLIKQLDTLSKRVDNAEADLRESNDRCTILLEEKLSLVQEKAELEIELTKVRFWKCEVEKCKKRIPPQYDKAEVEEESDEA
jgi:hypothetical protein